MMTANKKLLVSLVFLTSIISVGCAPSNMTVKSENFNIIEVKPEPGKSALVVARTTLFGGAINFFTYLNHKMIGVTRGKSCIVKRDIDPKQTYLIARTESLETGKINFEPDTVYYVQQSPRPGWVVARVNLTPVSPEHLSVEIGTEGCTLYEIDKNDIADDLSEHEYQEAVTDYEREITEGYHKDFTEYKGYKVKR
jgi:hypothetical protein